MQPMLTSSGKKFKVAMFILITSSILPQIFPLFTLYSSVIFKIIINADNIGPGNLQVRTG